MMHEVYKGRKIVITFSSAPCRVIGRHGSAGKSWTVSVDGENVIDRISYTRIKDENPIMIAAKSI